MKTEAAIPVDLFNPGQVFACLGFLEAADTLLVDAEGGFDWSEESSVRFLIAVEGDRNAFAVVLEFLAESDIRRCAPIGYEGPPPGKNNPSGEDDGAENEGGTQDLILSESFPDRQSDRMALPIRLESPEHSVVDLGHWADGSSRNKFKLYAGNRSAHSIACAMVRGTREKPKRNQRVGDLKTRGIAALWNQRKDQLTAEPFDALTLMGGSFNFDPRGAWTAIDAGYSPNEHNHGIAASPVVEMLASWGLEYARPDEYETRQVRYSAWSGLVPPILARPALAGIDVGVPIRTFRFALDLSGKNKIVTFAREETSQ